ncbi:MAG: 4Fe-4S binding protein, partial [Candidatus Omnitrophica bacterium]|nr:4Fe-4S binding protein [Candidatus Omnitrophota bacterium]
MNKLIVLRRTSQIFFLGLFVYILWSTTYPLKGVFPPETFFRFDPLIMWMTSLASRTLLAGTAVALVMVLVTLVFGRFFCGWVCPLGSMIDAAGVFRGKNDIVSPRANAVLRKIKYIELVIVTAAAFLGMQIAWILDPLVISARLVSINVIPGATFLVDNSFQIIIKNFRLYGAVYDLYSRLKMSFLGVKVFYFSNAMPILLFFVAILFLTLLSRRFWCRALCPLGALYALFSRFSIFELKFKGCANCPSCVKDCRMDAIEEGGRYRKSECILCMDCIYDCDKHDVSFALGRQFGEKKSSRTVIASPEGAKQSPQMYMRLLRRFAPRNDDACRQFATSSVIPGESAGGGRAP